MPELEEFIFDVFLFATERLLCCVGVAMRDGEVLGMETGKAERRQGVLVGKVLGDPIPKSLQKQEKHMLCTLQQAGRARKAHGSKPRNWEPETL